MSTLTMNKTSRLKLNTRKRGNKLKRRKRTKGSKLTSTGQTVLRLFMILLGLSLVAALAVGMLYLYRFTTTTSYFDLEKIQVAGNHRLTYGQILKIGHVHLGLNGFKMNIGEVETHLSSNPWIKSVSVRRGFPSTLHINVLERVPVFWIRQGSRLYFADAEGQLIAPVNPGETASLPILSIAEGIENSGPILQEFTQRIAAKKTPFTQAQIAWIKLTSSHEIEVFLDGHAKGKGLLVRVSTDNWKVQLERLKVAWRDLMHRGEFRSTAIIAASGDKIWIKKRQTR